MYNNVGLRVGNFKGIVWACPFSRTPLSFSAPCLGNPCEYSHKPYISRKQNHRSAFCRWYYGSIFIRVILVSFVTYFFRKSAFWPSRSSKVIDFGTNRKRVCDFLLIRHRNLGPILHRFGDTAGFCAHDLTSTSIHLNFWGVSVGLDCPCLGQPEHKP